MSTPVNTPGTLFREALQTESPLQVIGAINANHALLAKRAGYRAIYLSGGGVAAGSLGMPDLGINNLDDVLIDIRRITDVCDLPLMVDIDTGFGPSAFNIARTVKSLIKFGAAACHIEDQVGAKRCGHRPGKEIVSLQEMADRVKAAADAKTDPNFFLIARTDAIAVQGVDAAIERALACVEAGADGIFAEAANDLATYRRFVDAVKVPVLANITEFGKTPLFTVDELRSVRGRDGAVSVERVPRDEQGGGNRLHSDSPRRPSAQRHRHDADARRVVRPHRLSRLRTASRCTVRSPQE